MPLNISLNTNPPAELPAADTLILQGCACIMEAYNETSDMKPDGYEGLLALIEEQAEVIAPIAARSRAGVKAKAAVVQALARHGMACYAERILAGSLAADVLAEGAL